MIIGECPYCNMELDDYLTRELGDNGGPFDNFDCPNCNMSMDITIEYDPVFYCSAT